MSQYLPQKSGAIPLLAALTTESYFLYGNLASLTAGVIPYVQDQSSSAYEVVRGHHWFIERAKVTPPSQRSHNHFHQSGLRITHQPFTQITFPASTVLSGLLFGFTAFLTPDLRVKRLSAVAAVSSLTFVPYTLLVMLPTNKVLAELESAGPKALKGREDEAMETAKTWRRQHVVRVLSGVVAWVVGVAALEIL